MIPFQQAIFYESFHMISLLVTDLPRANSTIRQKSPHMKSTTLHCCNFWTNHAFSTTTTNLSFSFCTPIIYLQIYCKPGISVTPLSNVLFCKLEFFTKFANTLHKIFSLWSCTVQPQLKLASNDYKHKHKFHCFLLFYFQLVRNTKYAFKSLFLVVLNR